MTVSAIAKSYHRPDEQMLTNRWTPLFHHAEQRRLVTSDARFRIVPAGRRSGKTELAKRFIVKDAVRFTAFSDGNFVCAAPTHKQARRIFWSDLKRLVPRSLWASRPRESDLTLRLFNGATLYVVGMDVPERIEGIPIDGLIFDEYGNAKPESWTEHLRPALSTRGRPGWAWMIGVPEGQNHYWMLAEFAKKDKTGTWILCTWYSEDILDPEEIVAAKAELDPITYRQEYQGEFVSFEGRVYYSFLGETHAQPLEYDQTKDLVLCFDFNNSPGVCAVIQELNNPKVQKGKIIRRKYRGTSETFTGVIGEVFIERNSNTELVCRKLEEDWAHHKGKVIVHGDPAGGAKVSSATKGTDWDIIKGMLDKTFKNRVVYRYGRKAPSVRVRVNAMNTRIKTADGLIHLLADPNNAPSMVRDFESTAFVKGGPFEIDKKTNPMVTHLTDAVGYYIQKAFPIGGPRHVQRKIM